jgi:uncharacterized membrane protein YhiD involved in acid resistance
MNDNIPNIAIAFIGVLAAAIGHLFDVPPATLWVAAIGSALGVAFSKEASLIAAFILIVVGTLATGWAVPVVLKFAPDIAQKSVAAFMAFTFIAFRVQIRQEAPKILTAIFIRIQDFIRGNKA